MLEGFTPAEVADTLGITANAVAIRGTRARDMLRALMEARHERTTPAEWNDLRKLWQADAAGVSLQRNRRASAARSGGRCWASPSRSWRGSAAGIVAAACGACSSTHVWLGVVIVLFAGVSAWITLRMRREGAPPGSVDLCNR